MSVQMVRFRTSPELSAAVADHIAVLFAAVRAAAAASFRSWLPGQTIDDPTPRANTVLGRYRA